MIENCFLGISAFYHDSAAVVINVRGEPIVCSPRDAYQCFMRTEMDWLVINNCLFEKSVQPEWEETENWRQEIQLD